MSTKYSKINWLAYQSRNDNFLINGKLFARGIQEITGDFLEPKQLIKLLELDTELIDTKFKGKNSQKFGISNNMKINEYKSFKDLKKLNQTKIKDSKIKHIKKCKNPNQICVQV